MPSIPTRSPWDFSDALELLHSPSEKHELPVLHENAKLDTASTKRAAGLGDFSKIWQALGTTPDFAEESDNQRVSVSTRDYDLPNPNRPPAPPLRDDTYASDGGYYSARKNVTWKDEPEYMDATDVPTTPVSDDGATQSLGSPFHSNSEEQSQDAIAQIKKEAKRVKKQRQKQKKLVEQDENEKARTRKVVSDIESESEIRQHAKLTPASKASKHSKSPIGASSTLTHARTGDTQVEITESKQRITDTADSSDNPTRRKHKRGRSKDIPSSSFVPSTPKKTVLVTNHLLPTSLPQQLVAKLTSTPSQQLFQSFQSQAPSNAFSANLPVFTTSTQTPSSAKQLARQVHPSFIPPEQKPKVDTSLIPFHNVGSTIFNDSREERKVVCASTGRHRNRLNGSQKAKEDQCRRPIVPPIPPKSPLPVHRQSAMYSSLLGVSWGAYLNYSASVAASQFAQTNAATSSSLLCICHQHSLTALLSSPFQILEKEERDLQLFLRLIHEFKEDKKWLTRPVPMADHNTSPEGIHVFVDFSNIWIGFMDHLKELQVQMHQRIPHQNISFDALVLLLERKRPVTKRVLAGSYPLLPAMELAKQIGYETLILEKVYKSREPTERQRRTLALQSRNAFAALGTQGIPNSFSTIGTVGTSPPKLSPFAPLPAPEKWVEQGVDEILHLKMLESLVDSAVPSRMVVATGDAAKAEYSEGFMKMIVRALNKGWHVELVAFSKSISAAYWNKTFRDEWGSKFEIIVLDGWAQFLLAT